MGKDDKVVLRLQQTKTGDTPSRPDEKKSQLTLSREILLSQLKEENIENLHTPNTLKKLLDKSPKQAMKLNQDDEFRSSAFPDSLQQPDEKDDENCLFGDDNDDLMDELQQSTPSQSFLSPNNRNAPTIVIPNDYQMALGKTQNNTHQPIKLQEIGEADVEVVVSDLDNEEMEPQLESQAEKEEKKVQNAPIEIIEEEDDENMSDSPIKGPTTPKSSKSINEVPQNNQQEEED